MEAVRSAEGPFSPGWENKPVAAEKTPNKSARKEEANTAKKTPKIADNTPKGRHTSPKSEFGYDDAYSVGGDDFTERKSGLNQLFRPVDVLLTTFSIFVF